MLIVGLTGGIGSGKTTVSNLFKDLGIDVIDTDVIAHDLVNNDKSTVHEIISLFGNDILNDDDSINRKKLAAIVFSKKKYKQQLEAVLHPKIRQQVKKQIQKFNLSSAPPKYVIVVIPLLFETGFNDLIDRVLVVLSDEAVRVQRIKQRDHRSLDEIRSIIDSQVSDERRISDADDIIENNTDLAELKPQIKKLHETYKNSTV
jgi:dephospho-CoA kinase